MGTLISPAGEVSWFHVDPPSGDARVRRAAAALAERLGFGAARIGEVEIVAAELTSNLARHAAGGSIALRRLNARPSTGIGLLAIDDGPGMDDVALSLVDGQSTSTTLGIGLGAIRRLATSADVYSLPGRGTVVDVTLCAEGSRLESDDVAGLTRSMANEEVCGDAFLTVCEPTRRLLVLADGLGHGPLAATASKAALQIVVDAPERRPADLVAEMDRRIRHTRGAAVAVAEVDVGRLEVRFAGLGNVAGWIVGDERRQGMTSQPGIVGGNNVKQIRENVFTAEPGATIVLHSDGLSDKWDLSSYPGARSRSSTVIAALLLRDAGIRHDDASVVVTNLAR